ncbi:MAG: TolC family protein [Candidatus Marinimicrobia bacterium]|nr:TolC family protein [Candidatus Neomarinimicrobiota bacterium]
MIDHNPKLAAGLKQIDSQAELLEQSRKYSNPNIEIEMGSGTEPETVGMVSQSIPFGGKRKKKIHLNDLAVKKAQLEFDILKQTILMEAFAGFTGILHLQKRQVFQRDQILVSEDLLDAVSRKVEAGKLSPAEKSRARIQLYQERLKLRDVESALKTAWMSLANLWGDDTTTFFKAEGEFNSISPIPTIESLDKVLQIKLAKIKIEIQQAILLQEKTEAIPDMELGVGVKQGNNSGNTYQFGLTIPFPVFDRNKSNIASAGSKLEITRLELIEVEIRIQSTISNLITELEVLAFEIGILTNDINPEAQSAYVTISEGYLNGRFTYLDVVDAQRMWFESREQYIGALKDYHINILELNRIIGQKNTMEIH